MAIEGKSSAMVCLPLLGVASRKFHALTVMVNSSWQVTTVGLRYHDYGDYGDSVVCV